MRDFCFIHAADIHLDSPLVGLARYEGAPASQLREATRTALRNLVALAIEVGAKFVVIAGDLYDDTWREMRTGLFAVEQFGRLARAGIQVFIVYGNHDAANKITKSLTMPDGVHIFDWKGCETRVLEDLGVALHGQSFKHARTEDNLARGYCRPTPGYLNIAVLHTALEGGHRHANYAPCKMDELAASGHDYWALGHVHNFGVLRLEPYVVYPGNLQGRHVRETGAKGAVVVHVENGRIAGAEHRALDEVRWDLIDLSTDGMKNEKDFAAAVDEAIATSARSGGDRLLAARVSVRLTGPYGARVAADRLLFDAEVRASASRTGIDCWIEKVLFTRDEGVAYELPPVIADILATAQSDPDLLRDLEDEMAALIAKLPVEVYEEDTTPLLLAAKRGDLARVLEESQSLLAAKLQGDRS